MALPRLFNLRPQGQGRVAWSISESWTRMYLFNPIRITTVAHRCDIECILNSFLWLWGKPLCPIRPWCYARVWHWPLEGCFDAPSSPPHCFGWWCLTGIRFKVCICHLPFCITMFMIFNPRFRNVPTFGSDVIRRFAINVSSQKRITARDYEDFLQVSLVLFTKH